MPHLVKWHSELSDGGLAVIGMHVQPAEDAQVVAKAKSLGVRFSLTAGGSIAGVKTNGIPHCVLFDHTGKVVYEGPPNKAEAKLREAYADMLAAAAGGGEPGKVVADALELFKRGGTVEMLVRKLLAAQATPGAAREQAKAVLARLQDGAQARVDEANSLKESNPVAAFDAAGEVAVRWRGTPLGKEAGELVNRLKGEKVVAAELKVRPTLEKLKAREAAILAAAKGTEPESPEFQKAFAPLLRGVEQTVSSMKRTAPDAPATAEAEAIARRLGLGK